MKARKVVEKDNAGDAGGILGFTEAGSDDGVEATRFVDEGCSDPVGFFLKKIAGGFGAAGSVEARNDGASWLAAGVGVDDFHLNEEGGLDKIPRGVFDLLAFPIAPPVPKESVLVVEEFLLGRAQLIVGIELLLVSGVTLEDHEFFVVKDEVWAFVEGGKDGERFGELECVAAGLGVAFSRGFAEFDKTENFFWKSITNSGDGSGRSTVDKAVVDLRVNPSHENERFVLACDILGGVAEGIGSTEFLEPDEGGKFFTKREEEVGLSLEPIIRRVVNHRRKVTACLENFAEVMNLGSGR